MIQSGRFNPFPVMSFLFNPIGVLTKKIVGLGITLPNNEIKDIVKVIRSSENRNFIKRN